MNVSSDSYNFLLVELARVTRQLLVTLAGRGGLFLGGDLLQRFLSVTSVLRLLREPLEDTEPDRHDEGDHNLMEKGSLILFRSYKRKRDGGMRLGGIKDRNLQYTFNVVTYPLKTSGELVNGV